MELGTENAQSMLRRLRSTSPILLTRATGFTLKEKILPPGNSMRTLTTCGQILHKMKVAPMNAHTQMPQTRDRDLPVQNNVCLLFPADHAPSRWAHLTTPRPNSLKHGPEWMPRPCRGHAATPPPTTTLTGLPPHPFHDGTRPKTQTIMLLATKHQQVSHFATRPTQSSRP